MRSASVRPLRWFVRCAALSTAATAPSVMASTTTSSSTCSAEGGLCISAEARVRGASWGLFAADALAAPTHWYYGGFEVDEMESNERNNFDMAQAARFEMESNERHNFDMAQAARRL